MAGHWPAWVGRRPRRVGALGLALSIAAALLTAIAPPRAVFAAANPIVTENQQPGSSAWQLGSLVSDDGTGQIKGYASATSVNQTQSITFYVTVNPVQTYTIDVYRIGWYASLGGRLRLHAGPLSGVHQQTCPRDGTTGMVSCNWSASYTLTVPSDWTSGIYLGLLTNAQGYQNYIIFTVRDGRSAPFLFQQSVTTYAAYNNYPADGVTGKSLYEYNSYGPNTVAGTVRAVKVSFDRPYTYGGDGDFRSWEIEMVRWLERSGYDVTYSTNLDTHSNGAALRNGKAFLSTGHDEYWSREMFDAAQAARDVGISLGFFGGNPVGWQIRFEPSAGGVANRIVVCYKDSTIDPVQGPTATVEWANPLINRPEQVLTGLQFTSQLTWGQNAGYVVSNSSHWMYAGTGFHDGDVVPGIVGYEVDRYMSNLPLPTLTSRTLLSQSPVTSVGGVPDVANSSIYQVASGAWVFDTGTMSWSWALDNYDHTVADTRIQQATANVLNTFLSGTPQPPPLLQVAGVQAGGVGATSAVISWTTNNTATSRVNYGPTTTYGSVVSDPISQTAHAMTLTGLSPNTAYHFQVTSVDLYSQSAASTDATLTTTVPPAGWTWVQGTSGADALISGGTYRLTIAPPATGNFLALSTVVVDHNSAGLPKVSSISDNGAPASTWTKAVAVTTALNMSGEIWYASNVRGSPTSITVTITPGGSTAPDQISRVDEYAGIAATSALDQATGHEVDGVAACSTGTTGATIMDKELGIALYGDNNQGVTLTSPAGWTERRNGSSLGKNAGQVVIDRAVPTGTQSATFTSNYATYGLTAIATFKLGSTQPPPALQVNAVQVGGITANSATITWTSTNPANGRVDYGTSATYGSSVTDASIVASHSMTVTGLAPNTVYHFKVTSVDNYAQTASSLDATFTTLPPPVLQLLSVQAGTITPTSVTITWTTTNAANSRVDYGLTATYGSFVTNASQATGHSMTLTGLTPNTPYHYKVTSVDGFGQSASSADATVTTLPPPALQLTVVQAGTITTTSAVITWTSSNPADSRIDYGLTTTYGTYVSNPSQVSSHSMTVTGLTPNTTYHFKVTSVDGFAQSASSADAPFTTLSLPALQLTVVQAGSIATTSAVITWTSSNAATSRVDYGLTSTYGTFVTNASSVTSHSMTLTGLTANTAYHYKVTSIDAYAQSASSGDLSFTTLAVPKGWAWVKGTTGADALISGTTFTISIGAPAKGDFLVLSSIVVDHNSVGLPTIASITDNGSPASTWAKAVATTTSGLNTSGEIWYAANVSGAPTTITVTIASGGSGAPDQMSRLDEYSGVAASAPLDQRAGQEVDAVTACSTGTTGATTVDKELAIAIYGDNNQGVSITSPTGWTQRRNTSSWGLNAGEVVIDKSVPIGTQSATFTSNYGVYAVTAIATFKPAP